jgi:hypothetical protein
MAHRSAASPSRAVWQCRLPANQRGRWSTTGSGRSSSGGSRAGGTGAAAESARASRAQRRPQPSARPSSESGSRRPGRPDTAPTTRAWLRRMPGEPALPAPQPAKDRPRCRDRRREAVHRGARPTSGHRPRGGPHGAPTPPFAGPCDQNRVPGQACQVKAESSSGLTGDSRRAAPVPRTTFWLTRVGDDRYESAMGRSAGRFAGPCSSLGWFCCWDISMRGRRMGTPGHSTAWRAVPRPTTGRRHESRRQL